MQEMANPLCQMSMISKTSASESTINNSMMSKGSL